MTDLLSLRVRFITESNAMETQMDMVSPTHSPTLPETMNPALFSSFCEFTGEAMLHWDRMG